MHSLTFLTVYFILVYALRMGSWCDTMGELILWVTPPPFWGALAGFIIYDLAYCGIIKTEE